MNTFYVKIEPPKSVNIAHLNPHEVQSAFSNFFLQNPQILTRIFETLGKIDVKQSIPLPQIKQAEELAVINQARDYTDEQWDKLFPNSRSEDSPELSSDFFKKTAMSLKHGRLTTTYCRTTLK